MVLIKNGTQSEVIQLRDSGMWTVKLLDLNSDFRARRKPKQKKKARRNKARVLVPTKYLSYINSKFWRQRKARYFSTHKQQCVICKGASQIELHHIVYSEQGNEKDKHLIPVCHTHHIEFHEKYGSKGNMEAEWAEYLIECKS